jgi:superfamily II DNA or RNA helicase
VLAELRFTQNLISATISILYKRPFRKGKEVTTFLIKAKMIKLAWNLRIEPRPYQSEATEWALAKGQAVCSLPTGTGKALVAVLWLKSRFQDSKVF